jgi:hypothetical protein
VGQIPWSFKAAVEEGEKGGGGEEHGQGVCVLEKENNHMVKQSVQTL